MCCAVSLRKLSAMLYVAHMQRQTEKHAGIKTQIHLSCVASRGVWSTSDYIQMRLPAPIRSRSNPASLSCTPPPAASTPRPPWTHRWLAPARADRARGPCRPSRRAWAASTSRAAMRSDSCLLRPLTRCRVAAVDGVQAGCGCGKNTLVAMATLNRQGVLFSIKNAHCVACRMRYGRTADEDPAPWKGEKTKPISEGGKSSTDRAEKAVTAILGGHSFSHLFAAVSSGSFSSYRGDLIFGDIFSIFNNFSYTTHTTHTTRFCKKH